MMTLVKFVRVNAAFTLRNAEGEASFVMGEERKALCDQSTITSIEPGASYTLRPRTFVHVASDAAIIPSKLDRAQHVASLHP